MQVVTLDLHVQKGEPPFFRIDGNKVLAIKPMADSDFISIVLVDWEGGVQPFSTHLLNHNEGGFCAGNYFAKLEDAKKDFEGRC